MQLLGKTIKYLYEVRLRHFLWLSINISPNKKASKRRSQRSGGSLPAKALPEYIKTQSSWVPAASTAHWFITTSSGLLRRYVSTIPALAHPYWRRVSYTYRRQKNPTKKKPKTPKELCWEWHCKLDLVVLWFFGAAKLSLCSVNFHPHHCPGNKLKLQSQFCL